VVAFILHVEVGDGLTGWRHAVGKGRERERGSHLDRHAVPRPVATQSRWAQATRRDHAA
jgi:hypothetical protein